MGLWIALVWLIWVSVSPALAEVYRWTDEAGKIHLTDNLDTIPAKRAYLPPLPHKLGGGLHIPYAAELLKIGLTLLARHGNLLFEFGNVLRRWRVRRFGCL